MEAVHFKYTRTHARVLLQSLEGFLSARGLHLPPGQLTTVYRVEVRGETYYSRMYKSVRKRNSYTVVFSDAAAGAQEFALLNILCT